MKFTISNTAIYITDFFVILTLNFSGGFLVATDHDRGDPADSGPGGGLPLRPADLPRLQGPGQAADREEGEEQHAQGLHGEAEQPGGELEEREEPGECRLQRVHH